MGKATVLSADNFLAAIAGETEEFELPGGGVVMVRSLNYVEVQRGIRLHKDDDSELAFYALELGLVEPKLTGEQWAAVRQSKAGPLLKVARRIMQISGMTDQDELEKKPGGGS